MFRGTFLGVSYEAIPSPTPARSLRPSLEHSASSQRRRVFPSHRVTTVNGMVVHQLRLPGRAEILERPLPRDEPGPFDDPVCLRSQIR